MSRNATIEKYGWTGVPVKLETLLAQSQASKSGPAKPILVSSVHVPDSALAKAAVEYVRMELPIETFNHSMRVYYYGQAILVHAFPEWKSASFDETYLLTCMYHDIGATPKNLEATLMSFEFYGAFLALSALRAQGAPVEQAENVAEAVIRHQDLGDEGSITRIGALIQLATIFDNMGLNPELVARETIESVVEAYPRKGWSGCFAKTIRRENGLKSWAHSTHLGFDAFPDGVAGNKLMAPYDNLE